MTHKNFFAFILCSISVQVFGSETKEAFVQKQRININNQSGFKLYCYQVPINSNLNARNSYCLPKEECNFILTAQDELHLSIDNERNERTIRFNQYKGTKIALTVKGLHNFMDIREDKGKQLP